MHPAYFWRILYIHTVHTYPYAYIREGILYIISPLQLSIQHLLYWKYITYTVVTVFVYYFSPQGNRTFSDCRPQHPRRPAGWFIIYWSDFSISWLYIGSSPHFSSYSVCMYLCIYRMYVCVYIQYVCMYVTSCIDACLWMVCMYVIYSSMRIWDRLQFICFSLPLHHYHIISLLYHYTRYCLASSFWICPCLREWMRCPHLSM